MRKAFCAGFLLVLAMVCNSAFAGETECKSHMGAGMAAYSRSMAVVSDTVASEATGQCDTSSDRVPA